MTFEGFKLEVDKRKGTGYHMVSKYDRDAHEMYSTLNFEMDDGYISFINEIGYGKFFAGNLIIFTISEIKEAIKLNPSIDSSLIPIGYDGTTTGFYILTNRKEDRQVYWFDIQEGLKSVVGKDFVEWIEGLPAKLFNKKTYAGFKKIRDIKAIQRIVEERKKFDLVLKSYDKVLVRPPGKENDLLPRYNRVILTVRKKDDSNLALLTVILRRMGSDVGNDNQECVTLDVLHVPKGKGVDIEKYVFDPFNLPFETIDCHYDYNINLGSSMRTMFKEITEYL